MFHRGSPRPTRRNPILNLLTVPLVSKRVTPSVHGGIGRTEDASGTVLPDPGMEHPLRKSVESPTLRDTVCLVQVAFDAAVGEDAQIRVAVP